MKKRLIFLALIVFFGVQYANSQVQHANSQVEYFLAVDGDDSASGTSVGTAFGTLQKGIDALEPGDTLTILPGEYLDFARRQGLGSTEVDTVIRAAIPGTVVLRGDVPAPEFSKVAGYRTVYAADFEGPVHGVSELDNLRSLKKTIFVDDLDLTPGRYFYDEDKGRLYISASDWQPATNYHYTISVIGKQGLLLLNATRVIVDGINFAGFQQPVRANRNDGTSYATYGLFIVEGTECVIRNCRAYFNSRGIGISAVDDKKGRNRIAHSQVWANWEHGVAPSGGALFLFQPWHCEIRDSVAFRNDGTGLRIYQSGYGGISYRNLAWGNSVDMDTKSDKALSYRSVGIGSWGGDTVRQVVRRSLVGEIAGVGTQFADNIIFEDRSQPEETRDYQDLRPDVEFVDAANHDYRLQSTSRFIGAGSDGSDLGPFPYEANVYFVSASGDDAADGLSLGAAWQTLEHAAGKLSAGDTLYLLPGQHNGRLTLTGINSDAAEPLRIRGHGHGNAVLVDGLQIENCSNVEVERIEAGETVQVASSGEVLFQNTVFSAGSSGLILDNVDSVVIDHCDFTRGADARLTASGSRNVFLQGNWFDNTAGPALQVDSADGLLFVDYNSYHRDAAIVVVDGRAHSAETLPSDWERHGSFGSRGLGLYAREAGVYVMDPPYVSVVVKPEIHRVGATTANFIWRSSVLGSYTVAWGDSKDTPHQQEILGENTATFSLTGLEPSTTYYFRIVAGERLSEGDALKETAALEIDSGILSFTTAAEDPAPREYYVSPDGDNSASGLSLDQAWSSLNHAALQVGPGDTVWVAEGSYSERVLVRATGTAEAPISFRAIPGAKVTMDSQELLTGFFVVDYKDHIHIDGFQFSWVNRSQTFPYIPGSAVRAIQADFLRISRCILDGASNSASSGSLASIFYSADVTISNCVQIRNMNRLLIVDCPNFTIENCVFLRPNIASLTIINRPWQPVVVRDTLFTDSRTSKPNSRMIELGRHESLELENVGFFLRQPAGDRVLTGIYGDMAYLRSAEAYDMVGDLFGEEHEPIEDEPIVTTATVVQWFADYADGTDEFIEGDPGFARVVANQDGVTKHLESRRRRYPTWQSFDWMVGGSGSREFSDFFLTDPEYVRRGIGLQPEAFADWQ